LLESADRMAGDLAAALERSRIAGQARQCPRPWSVNARMMGRPDLHSAWAHSLGGARMVGKRLNLSVPFSSSYWL
jgi:hypothetical protein